MENWSIEKTTIKESHIVKYNILLKNTKLSNSEVIKLWIKNNQFRRFYNEILVHNEFRAFYYEHPSISENQLNDAYEFVLIDSNILTKVNADSNAFAKHFTKDKEVVVFPNLGKDALLIVPTPQSTNNHYAHIAAFIRNAPDRQIDQWWKTFGEVYHQSIGSNRIWLSTAGLGVSWLHLRIDSRPKYYKFAAYKL